MVHDINRQNQAPKTLPRVFYKFIFFRSTFFLHPITMNPELQSQMEIVRTISSPTAAGLGVLAYLECKSLGRRLDALMEQNGCKLPPRHRGARYGALLCVCAAFFGWGCKSTDVTIAGVGHLKRSVPFPMSDDFRIKMTMTNGMVIEAGAVTSSQAVIESATKLAETLRP